MKRLFVVLGVVAVMMAGCSENSSGSGKPKAVTQQEKTKFDYSLIEAKQKCQTAFQDWKVKYPYIIHIINGGAHFNVSLNACIVGYEIRTNGAGDTSYDIDIFNNSQPITEYFLSDDKTYCKINGKIVDDTIDAWKPCAEKENELFESQQ